MIWIGEEIIAVLLPFIISIPAYIGGRKLWFKNVPQADMHTIKSGKIFTLIIGIIHIVLMIAVYFALFF